MSGPALREQSIISDIHGISQSGKTEFKRSDISSHEFREIKLQHSLYISLSLIKKYLIGEDPVPHIIIHPFPLETLKAHIYLQYSIYCLLSHSALKSEGNKDLAEPDTSGSPAGYETDTKTTRISNKTRGPTTETSPGLFPEELPGLCSALLYSC